MRTVDRRARLSGDRAHVLCARDLGNGFYCETELAAIVRAPNGARHIWWESDWYDAGVCLKRTGWERKRRGYAPTRRGWKATLPDNRLKPRKSFAFGKPAKCHCGLLNELDAELLDVTEMPKL
jgi:hypothetical protein